MATLKCETCERPFEGRRDHISRFCSIACRREGQSVLRNCLQCGSQFRVPKARSDAKFCDKSCYDSYQTSAERKEIVCESCGTKFVTKADHGVWPKFCSRACFLKDCIRPEQRTCPVCNGSFLAERTGHGLAVYCSMKCYHNSMRNGTNKTCVNCGDEFYIIPSHQRQRPEDSCCSQACHTEFYREHRHHAWKGGRYLSESSGRVVVRAERPGYVAKYAGEHRIIASRIIGRLLERHEPVLHLNQHHDDNHPDNLFICGSRGEAARYLQGSLPWPKRSNLASYR